MRANALRRNLSSEALKGFKVDSAPNAKVSSFSLMCIILFFLMSLYLDHISDILQLKIDLSSEFENYVTVQ